MTEDEIRRNRGGLHRVMALRLMFAGRRGKKSPAGGCGQLIYEPMACLLVVTYKDENPLPG